MFPYHHSWAMMAGMFVFWLVVLAVGVILLAKLFPSLSDRPGASQDRRPEREDAAVQVIRQRYARGEISKAEYEELLHTLT